MGSAGVDAVVHHRGGPTSHDAASHVENAGPCPAHAGHCALGLQITGPRIPATADMRVRSAPLETPPVAPGGGEREPNQDPTPFQQTRAPPTPV